CQPGRWHQGGGAPRPYYGTPALPVAHHPEVDKEERAPDSQPRPEAILRQMIHPINAAKWDEYEESEHYVQDLELAQRHHRVADAVGGHLEQIFEQGHAPAGQGGDDPRLGAELLEVGVPGEGHEHVAQGEHEDGEADFAHGAPGGWRVM